MQVEGTEKPLEYLDSFSNGVGWVGCRAVTSPSLGVFKQKHFYSFLRNTVEKIPVMI